MTARLLTLRGLTRQQVKPLKAVAQVPAPAPSVTEQAAAGKYFHARTAVALHPKELAGELCVDSDDEEDEQHWEVRRVLHGSCARRDEASDGGCNSSRAQTKCRRAIDEFGDVTQIEKDFMFMWNAFIHKRRVFADALLADAAIEFAHAHRRELCADPELRRCFTLHLISLWDASLLEAPAMDGALRKLDEAGAAQ